MSGTLARVLRVRELLEEMKVLELETETSRLRGLESAAAQVRGWAQGGRRAAFAGLLAADTERCAFSTRSITMRFGAIRKS